MYLFLLAIWIMLNGKFTLEILLFGVVLSAAIYWFMCKFMNYSIRQDMAYAGIIPLVLQYIGVLIIEIIKANLAMLPYILTTEQKQEPVIISFKCKLKTRVSRVLLANSITLTPGTITVGLEGDEFQIHCLDRSMGEGIEDSIFVRLITRMEDRALTTLNKK